MVRLWRVLQMGVEEYVRRKKTCGILGRMSEIIGNFTRENEL